MIFGKRLPAPSHVPLMLLLLPQSLQALPAEPFVGGVSAGYLPPHGLFHLTPGERRAVSVPEPWNTEAEAR